MILLTFLSALFISSIAAVISITGLIAIFPGAPVTVGLMGAALELGKLVSASWLYRSWDNSNKLMKGYFISAVMVLSFITSIGIFGYLTKAHVEGTQNLGANSDQIVLIDNQIAQEQDDIASAKNTIQQLDKAISTLSGNERTAARAVSLRNSQRTERVSLNETIATSNRKIVELRAERAKLNAGQRQLETEVGPIKYIAQMIYGSDDATTLDKAVRLLTLMIIFVFDPLAILLVIAANQQLKDKPEPPEPESITKDTIKDNITNMTEWNPGAWFKMVKSPTASD
jgi:cell division protein FtsB